jgi:hypothetical protein
MNMKEHILAAMREQIDRWEALLSQMSEAQLTAPLFDKDWSVKDVVAHLWIWQQASLARIQAVAQNRDLRFPDWVGDLPWDWESEPDQTNEWIFENYHPLPWPQIHQQWKEGYLQLLEGCSPIPEPWLLDADRYPWLAGYSAALVLIASYEHHQEHLEQVAAAVKARPE